MQVASCERPLRTSGVWNVLVATAYNHGSVIDHIECDATSRRGSRNTPNDKLEWSSFFAQNLDGYRQCAVAGVLEGVTVMCCDAREIMPRSGRESYKMTRYDLNHYSEVLEGKMRHQGCQASEPASCQQPMASKAGEEARLTE